MNKKEQAGRLDYNSLVNIYGKGNTEFYFNKAKNYMTQNNVAGVSPLSLAKKWMEEDGIPKVRKSDREDVEKILDVWKEYYRLLREKGFVRLDELRFEIFGLFQFPDYFKWYMIKEKDGEYILVVSGMKPKKLKTEIYFQKELFELLGKPTKIYRRNPEMKGE